VVQVEENGLQVVCVTAMSSGLGHNRQIPEIIHKVELTKIAAWLVTRDRKLLRMTQG
jgi:hypothetical protein